MCEPRLGSSVPGYFLTTAAKHSCNSVSAGSAGYVIVSHSPYGFGIYSFKLVVF